MNKLTHVHVYNNITKDLNQTQPGGVAAKLYTTNDQLFTLGLDRKSWTSLGH